MTRPDRPPRPEGACLLCRCQWTGTDWHWPKAQSGYHTCPACEYGLGVTLREIRDAAVRLSPERLRGNGAGSPGYRSTSPANDLAIALTDKRNPAVVVKGDVPDVLGELASWAQQVRDVEKVSAPDGPATVHTECGTLLGYLTTITRQLWVDDFAQAMQSLLGHIRAGLGESEGRMRIGSCPECSAALSVRPTADVIECPCGARWHKTQWAMLGKVLQAEAS